MESGVGTTLALIIAGALWLVYLAPALRRNREFEATQKNAVRINQALRAFAQTTETPDEVVAELSHREAVIRQRERERLEREHEREIRARVRAEAHADAGIGSATARSVKLGLTGLGMVSALATAFFGFTGQWTPTIVSLVLIGVAGVGLVFVNGAASTNHVPVRRTQPTGLPEVDRSWTPNRVPKVHRSIPDGAGLVVTPEIERKVAEADRAARIREQAARLVANTEQPIDDRFGELGPVTEQVSAVDINAALRARRAQ